MNAQRIALDLVLEFIALCVMLTALCWAVALRF